MASRKRASSKHTKIFNLTETHNNTATDSTYTTTVLPAKAGNMLKVSVFLFVPYFYLVFYHYGKNIDAQLKRSIFINAGLSVFGFFVTLRMIPVASKYLLRRNMFGFDINKKGTPKGSVQVLVLLSPFSVFTYIPCVNV